MKTCKIRILSGSEKKIKDTPITYIACSSFPESMASVTNSTDGKRGVFRSVTTSHGRQDMRMKRNFGLQVDVRDSKTPGA